MQISTGTERTIKDYKHNSSGSSLMGSML